MNISILQDRLKEARKCLSSAYQRVRGDTNTVLLEQIGSADTQLLHIQTMVAEFVAQSSAVAPAPKPERQFGHYFKDVRHLDGVDVYRVLSLFEVTDPGVQHAIKKLLVTGKRGGKDRETDLREAIASVSRSLQMIAEDAK